MTITENWKRKKKKKNCLRSIKQKKVRIFPRFQQEREMGMQVNGSVIQNLVEEKKEETDLEGEGVQGNETVPVTIGYIN